MKGLVKQWVLGLYSDRSGTVIVLFQIKASCITALMSNDPVSGLTEIESLCMNCMKNGTTRLLLTTIPHFRELIIASFECSHCGHSNREVQSGTSLQEFGVRHVLNVLRAADLNRQVIKSDFCLATIPEIEFEIPPNTQKGVCNTLEGLLMGAVDGLTVGQADRMKQSPEIANRIQEIIERIKNYASGQSFPFTFILDDPSGNSFIQFEGLTPNHDSQLKTTHYQRSKEHLHEMGFFEERAIAEQSITESSEQKTVVPSLRRGGAELSCNHLPNQLISKGWDLGISIEENISRIRKEQDSNEHQNNINLEGISFDVDCPNCGKQGVNEMCEIDIPGFQHCMIMAFNCMNCGSRNNEVKAMSAYGEKAKKWTLKVETIEDLNRDVLKSDTASVIIPELEFEMCMGTLGGVFTTVEGIIVKIVEHLEGSSEMFSGDSAEKHQKNLFSDFIKKLKELTTVPSVLPFTLILDDPADLSMISSRHAEHRILHNTKNKHKESEQPEADLNLIIETYERTEEQNDDLGLTDMKVENY